MTLDTATLRQGGVAIVVAVAMCFASALAVAAPKSNNGKNGGGSDTSVMPSYIGSATALDLSLNLLLLKENIVLSDTGQLDSHGGSKDESLLNVDQGLVRASVLHATTVGSGHRTDSMAITAGLGLDLTSLGVDLSISATVLQAVASAQCTNGSPVLSGYSDIVGLTINGMPIEVSGKPNQTLDIGGLIKVTINEQVETDKSITVTALRVEVLGALGTPVAEVEVSRAEAGLICGSGPDGECPPAADFVTGGGFFFDDYGQRVNFGMNGGVFPNGNMKGRFNLVAPGHHIRGSSVLDYRIVDATTRELDYVADDGGATFCTVTVADNGEPGRSDTFGISCDSGYSASGTLSQGGNIQLHKPKSCKTDDDSKGGNGNKGGKKK
ncbi:choice-of-anchor P family protein [Marinobacter sp. DUT-3]|uniref:choice-of-anchor P family protein n=1 Tax=Marinobacter sp. DUT-3 TaxID=3412036 RepID=UPI003D17993D